jgi:hypothetical protein
MGHTSKENHAFDSLMGKLLTVPKSTIPELTAESKKESAFNPGKLGPRRQVTP